MPDSSAVEQVTVNHLVAGSNPARAAIHLAFFNLKHDLITKKLVKKLFLIPLVIIQLISALPLNAKDHCMQTNNQTQPAKSTFILIHGAWHGAWCWDKVIPLLKKEGYNVIAPNLPGLGTGTIAPELVTMKMYEDFIIDLIKQQEGKVILVGHSLAGGLISQVAEKIPEKIEKLIYLCAYYMQNEESSLDIIAKYPNPKQLEFNYYNDYKVFEVKEEYLQPFFYNDCSANDIEIAKKLLKPQSMEPFSAKIKITEGNYGQVEKIYIECTQDRAVPLEIQRMMIAQQPCRVYTLQTGHSPFFSNPQALVDFLSQETKSKKKKPKT